jgi:thiol-disulfide isomerase/thioredoxin
MRKRYLFLGLVAVGLGGCEQHSAGPTVQEKGSIAAGDIGPRLPDFSVMDFQGHKLTAAGLRGKVVLIDFWGTWCAPCKTEMPGYQALMDRYGAAGIHCRRVEGRRHAGY